MTLTLTCGLHLQSPVSYGHAYSHAKVQGQQSVVSEDKVETNGRTEAIALPAALIRSVIINANSAMNYSGFDMHE